MFEGKIRPCLKCGERWLTLVIRKALVECDCDSSGVHDHQYQAVNQWNIANTPPEELLRIKLRLEVSGLELPR